jgi:hypothetical protein
VGHHVFHHGDRRYVERDVEIERKPFGGDQYLFAYAIAFAGKHQAVRRQFRKLDGAPRRRRFFGPAGGGNKEQLLFDQRHAQHAGALMYFVGQGNVDLVALQSVEQHHTALLDQAELDGRKIAAGLIDEVATYQVGEAVGQAQHNAFALKPACGNYLAFCFIDQAQNLAGSLI